MFSSSLLGAMYRPTITIVQGTNDSAETIIRHSLLSTLAQFFGLTKRLSVTTYSIVRHQGFCFSVALPNRFTRKRNEGTGLSVYENGRRLDHPHSMHEDIRTLGQGRFSHWDDRLYFSTSDNSDPITNGRRYEVVEV